MGGVPKYRSNNILFYANFTIINDYLYCSMSVAELINKGLCFSKKLCFSPWQLNRDHINTKLNKLYELAAAALLLLVLVQYVFTIMSLLLCNEYDTDYWRYTMYSKYHQRMYMVWVVLVFDQKWEGLGFMH